jgi:hypothetical protein
MSIEIVTRILQANGQKLQAEPIVIKPFMIVIYKCL